MLFSDSLLNTLVRNLGKQLREKYGTRFTIACLVLGTIGVTMIIIAMSLLNFVASDKRQFVFGVMIGGLLLAMFAAQLAGIDQPTQIIEERLENAEKEVRDKPDAVRPVWELARTRLELYIRSNHHHLNWIFWITVLSMVGGFIIISYGVVYTMRNPAALKPSLLTIGSGVLVEFIAATFLVIHRETSRLAQGYFQTLERMTNVGMCITLLERIPEENAAARLEAQKDMISRILEAPGGEVKRIKRK